jgi:hypothetical protein
MWRTIVEICSQFTPQGYDQAFLGSQQRHGDVQDP